MGLLTLQCGQMHNQMRVNDEQKKPARIYPVIF